MNKAERELLKGLVDNIQESDDKIDVLERLYHEVKKLIKTNQNS